MSSGEDGVTPLLPGATSTLLAASSPPPPLAPMPAALLQLAAAAGGSVSAPHVPDSLQAATTAQYTPSMSPLVRPVPTLGIGTLPAPFVIQVPASIYDIRRGATLVGMPDGLARSVPVPCFSDEELSRLNTLGGIDPATELLEANPLRVVNFSDAHVRLAAEREMLALARCYGVEGLASRVMNTAGLLHSAIQLIQLLEAQPTTQADSRALISLPRAECADLVKSLTKERDEHVATTKLLTEERALSRQQAVPATVPLEVTNLKSEVDKLRRVAGQLSSEKADLQNQLSLISAELDEVQRKLSTALARTGDLETQLTSANAFSPDALMDFIASSVTLGGHWKRLHELLKLFRVGSSVPSTFRTSIQISARDEDSDDCGPYVLQVTSQPRSQPVSSPFATPSKPKPTRQAASSPTSSTFGLAKKVAQSPVSATTSKSTISFRDKPVRQARRLSLTGSPSKGSPPRGAATAQSDSPEVIDLTGSAPSTPRGHRLMRLAERLKLPTRPSVFKPMKVRALKQSSTRVSLYYAQRAIPAPYSWDWTRADVREFLFTGCSFWDAVDEVQKPQMLHDQFDKCVDSYVGLSHVLASS